MSITLLIFCFVAQGLGSEPVSLENFKNVTSAEERTKIILAASPEQREQLTIINQQLICEHNKLLQRWGSEEGIKRQHKALVAQVRGVDAPLRLVVQQCQMWQQYVADTLAANRTIGMTNDQQTKFSRVLQAEEKALGKRIPQVNELVCYLAPSPRALELNKAAQQILIPLEKRDSTGGLLHFTQEQREVIDREIDAIIRELETLPKLTPEQAQREYDDFSYQKILNLPDREH